MHRPYLTIYKHYINLISHDFIKLIGQIYINQLEHEQIIKL